MDYKKLNYDAILDWCFKNGKEDWLQEQLEAGKTFLTIKEAFVLTFMPDIKPPKKAKAMSMLEKFKARKAGK